MSRTRNQKPCLARLASRAKQARLAAKQARLAAKRAGRQAETSNQKLEKLKAILKKLGSVLIAYSGGVDSSFLLQTALEVLGRKNVLAVIARSQTYPKSEYRQAKTLARQLGANNITVYTEEFKNSKFNKNSLKRCFYCKSELFAKLTSIARNSGMNCVIDGSNYEDRLDYRPGSLAAKKFGVNSPLKEARLTKAEIRVWAKKAGLANWDKPAQACLASRIPYFSRITLKKLKTIEEAEYFLRKLGFRQVRVRLHDEVSKIEVDKNEITKFLTVGLRNKVIKKFNKIGFKFITLDLEGYRTGSLNKQYITKT